MEWLANRRSPADHRTKPDWFLTKKWAADRRLCGCSLGMGALYALFVTVGRELKTHGEFRLTAGSVLGGMGLFVLLTAVFAAAVFALFSLLDRQRGRERKQEPLIIRITGNGFVVFLLLILCWTPAWLAFFPGTFSADSVTQFYSFYDDMPYAHHPLVHTALLGTLMMTGIDLHPEGFATYGVALYSAVQMVLMAAMVGYACWWMKRRGVWAWARIIVTLLFMFNPFYAPWNFCAQKDVLFGGLVLIFGLQMADLWRFGMKPVRVAAFVVITVLMMFFRNNGVYAMALILPLCCWWARGKRVKLAVLLAACMAVYIVGNESMVRLMDAEKGSSVEMLSVPLQQMARSLEKDPELAARDEDGLLDTLYPTAELGSLYHEEISDPVRWEIDYDALDENMGGLMKLWLKMLPGHFKEYAEAPLIQNLPYYLPYADMLYNFDLVVKQIDLFPIEQTSFRPELQKDYMEYDQTLSFRGIPGTRLLADSAFYVWLALAGFAYACLRGERGSMMAFGYLLGIWITCLLGPVALMRYMLGLFYLVPVLWAHLLIPGRNVC